MVIFPWKQKIVGQSIQRCSAKKSGQTPRQKLMIRIIKSSKKFWSCSNKEKNYRQEQRGECSSFCQARQKFCSAFVSSFLQTKNLKIYQEFIKKTANPERRFGIAGKDETCRHFLFQPSNVLSAWGRARHFLSTGQSFLGEFPANNERTNNTTTKPGGGAGRRGRWLEQWVAGRMVECWKFWQKFISWRFILGQELVQCFGCSCWKPSTFF